MRTLIQVLSEQEQHRVHECSLEILAGTGVQVETDLGRRFLSDAGAHVDNSSKIVRFPRDFVEECLNLVPREVTLGARRPGWDLDMYSGETYLVGDGQAISVLDFGQDQSRPGTYADWLKVTRLTDAIDEIGGYWTMVDSGEDAEELSSLVRYWIDLFGHFSKHVQDGIEHKETAPWLLEVLQVIFGDKNTIRSTHPYSFLLCPQSPLMIDEQYTDAYLALRGYRIPAAIMPMPLMGGTAPGNMISTVIQGNCEVLAMLCLIQAAEPATPILYAPALAVMDPYTAMYSAGRIGNGILSAAAVEMGHYYNLPVEGTGGGTDHYIPGIQAGYERAMYTLMPTLSGPDLLVGPGLLGGSMILSLEQLILDVEMFKMAKQAARGIDTGESAWLPGVIQSVGPGGHFLEEDSTLEGMRGGEWYFSEIGHHGSFEAWLEAEKPDLLMEAHHLVNSLLDNHQPYPFPEEVEKELRQIEKRANKMEAGNKPR
jgi:trimethylamine--corrinoid protein Co-methyltransferase